MQLKDLNYADDLAVQFYTQQQMQKERIIVAPASAALLTQNTLDPLTRHYQQQHTVRENKSDFSGGRNQEALGVDRTHIKESTQLRHKASPHLESSGLKEKSMTKEYIMPRNGDRREKNEQKLNKTREGGPGQKELENAGRWPMVYWE
ncbi:unnamed protein product [Schistosoma margrebowiei]|uniref:Uncharacterized protein n=1 Tax=Schistosoma margrebowiei TaxID=48269 RepID=A0A183LW76_9TREM|nr:unnamed protein product [Schistosoma margrebowiei]